MEIKKRTQDEKLKSIGETLRELIKALLNIQEKYFTYARDNHNAQSDDDLEQRERVFAYELYHQWSKTNRSKRLVLNGEIGKHLNDKYMYPEEISGHYQMVYKYGKDSIFTSLFDFRQRLTAGIKRRIKAIIKSK